MRRGSECQVTSVKRQARRSILGQSQVRAEPSPNALWRWLALGSPGSAPLSLGLQLLSAGGRLPYVPCRAQLAAFHDPRIRSAGCRKFGRAWKKGGARPGEYYMTTTGQK